MIYHNKKGGLANLGNPIANKCVAHTPAFYGITRAL